MDNQLHYVFYQYNSEQILNLMESYILIYKIFKF